MRRRPIHTCASFYFQKSLSQIPYSYCKSFLSHTVICHWPVRIGRSFMGTIALAIVGMRDNCMNV